MNKNILKVFGFAALLALGVQTAEASDPAYYSYVSLYTASSSAGLGKVAANSGLINDLRNYMGEKRENVSSSYYSEEVGARTNWKSKNILIYIWAIPNDGSEFVGWYMDDACTKPLEEDEVAKVYEVAAHGAMTPAGAVESSVNLPTVTDASAATKIYAKFVKTASSAVAKIGDKEYETLAAAVAAANDGDTVTIVSGDPVGIDGVSINKNVTIEGAGADKTVLDMGTGSMGGVASKTVTYRNLTLRYNNTGTMPYTQGVNHAMQAYDHVTITGSIAVMDDTLFDTCTFTGALDDGTTVPEYLVWIYAHKATFTNCTFEKAGSKGSIKLYAEAGNMCATEVSGTTFKEIGSKGSAIYTSNSNNSSSTTKVVYEVVTDDASIAVPEGKVIVKASGNGLSVVNPVKDANGKYIGGQFITASTDQSTIESIIGNVCAEGYAPKKNDDGTWGVEVAAKNFYQDETDKSLWHVANAEGMKEFAVSVQKDKSELPYSGKTVVLDADIDLTGVEGWTSVGDTQGHRFAGTFDGNGKTIKFSSTMTPRYGAGLFADVNSGTVLKNFIVENGCVGGAGGGNVYGVVCGYAYGNVSFENILVKNSDVEGFGKVGAILGMAADPSGTTTFRNCQVVNTVVRGTYNCGGLCGLAQNKVVVEDCDVSGAIFEGDATYVELNTTASNGSSGPVPVKGLYWEYPYEGITYYFAAWGDYYCDLHYEDWEIAGLKTGSYLADGLCHNLPVVEVEVEIPEEGKIEAKDETGAPITDKDAAEKAVEAAETAIQEIAGNKSAEMAGTGVGEAIVEKNPASGDQEVKPSIVGALESQVDEAENLTEGQKADVKKQVSESKDVSSYVNVKVESPLVKVATVQEEKVATVQALVYDVKPMAVTKVTTTVDTEEPKAVTVEAPIENAEIEKPIVFRLPLTDEFAMSAKVRHESDDENYEIEEFVCPVKGSAGGRYVEITTTHFSTFILSPYNAVVTESDETLGIVKVAKTAGGETVAGVPFRKFDVTSGTAKAMTVDQLLVAGFGQDDDIYAYNPTKPSGDEYDMWAWDGEKWDIVPGPTQPPAAESAEIASGKAFWFKDESGSTTHLTLAGLYQENVTTTVDVGKKSLLVNPYPVAINAAEKLKEGACAGDQFALVGGSDRYEFRDGAWGVVAKGTVIKELPGGIKIYGSDTFTPAAEIVIPAGQAFWYISTGATAPTVAW